MKVCFITTTFLAIALSGCASIQTTPQGAAVELASEKPQGCKLLGEAIGSQGNSFTGDFTKDSALLQGARNDLRNKTAAMGGNVAHIQQASNSSSFGSLGTTNSTVIGNVYSCPRG